MLRALSEFTHCFPENYFSLKMCVDIEEKSCEYSRAQTSSRVATLLDRRETDELNLIMDTEVLIEKTESNHVPPVLTAKMISSNRNYTVFCAFVKHKESDFFKK